jgi:hypothetical protein
MAASEADAARATLKAGRKTVRQFLRERFGIVTWVREYWHRENWAPDRADLQEFLGALRETRRAARQNQKSKNLLACVCECVYACV